jgi:hypothetical protein
MPESLADDRRAEAAVVALPLAVAYEFSVQHARLSRRNLRLMRPRIFR